ncbi:MOSC domain-containing protein [Sporosarcina thermotolerans]|uniref:MOSC domain-containing protein n=1 Tax=Sporosarcina thermotolerans TaxID=633404 RepID=A0AAW9AC63_9BACL|nr:MOSC domain-containing protein [Sporosarcina thermotolerans]MDW0117238.1 MOSC domain-containing protein [Sporosarcina thermotolerans]
MEKIIKEIFVGKPQTVGDKNAANYMDKEWESAIFKKPVTGRVWVGKNGLDGDGQADTKNHGGPEKAIFAYPSEHYGYFHDEFDLTAMKAGGMGENLTLANMLEDEVCIGDIYEIGEVVIQVSQPRQPCWKPARRFRRKDLSLLIQDSGKTGWYFRVLKEGYISDGQKPKLVDRPAPEWTIENCNHVMHVDRENKEKAAALAACEWLAISWKNTLNKRVGVGVQSSTDKRLYGDDD